MPTPSKIPAPSPSPSASAMTSKRTHLTTIPIATNASRPDLKSETQLEDQEQWIYWKYRGMARLEEKRTLHWRPEGNWESEPSEEGRCAEEGWSTGSSSSDEHEESLKNDFLEEEGEDEGRDDMCEDGEREQNLKQNHTELGGESNVEEIEWGEYDGNESDKSKDEDYQGDGDESQTSHVDIVEGRNSKKDEPDAKNDQINNGHEIPEQVGANQNLDSHFNQVIEDAAIVSNELSRSEETDDEEGGARAVALSRQLSGHLDEPAQIKEFDAADDSHSCMAATKISKLEVFSEKQLSDKDRNGIDLFTDLIPTIEIIGLSTQSEGDSIMNIPADGTSGYLIHAQEDQKDTAAELAPMDNAAEQSNETQDNVSQGTTAAMKELLEELFGDSNLTPIDDAAMHSDETQDKVGQSTTMETKTLLEELLGESDLKSMKDATTKDHRAQDEDKVAKPTEVEVKPGYSRRSSSAAETGDSESLDYLLEITPSTSNQVESIALRPENLIANDHITAFDQESNTPINFATSTARLCVCVTKDKKKRVLFPILEDYDDYTIGRSKKAKLDALLPIVSVEKILSTGRTTHGEDLGIINHRTRGPAMGILTQSKVEEPKVAHAKLGESIFGKSKDVNKHSSEIKAAEKETAARDHEVHHQQVRLSEIATAPVKKFITTATTGKRKYSVGPYPALTMTEPQALLVERAEFRGMVQMSLDCAAEDDVSVEDAVEAKSSEQESSYLNELELHDEKRGNEQRLGDMAEDFGARIEHDEQAAPDTNISRSNIVTKDQRKTNEAPRPNITDLSRDEKTLGGPLEDAEPGSQDRKGIGQKKSTLESNVDDKNHLESEEQHNLDSGNELPRNEQQAERQHIETEPKISGNQLVGKGAKIPPSRAENGNQPNLSSIGIHSGAKQEKEQGPNKYRANNPSAISKKEHSMEPSDKPIFDELSARPKDLSNDRELPSVNRKSQRKRDSSSTDKEYRLVDERHESLYPPIKRRERHQRLRNHNFVPATTEAIQQRTSANEAKISTKDENSHDDTDDDGVKTATRVCEQDYSIEETGRIDEHERSISPVQPKIQDVDIFHPQPSVTTTLYPEHRIIYPDTRSTPSSPRPSTNKPSEYYTSQASSSNDRNEDDEENEENQHDEEVEHDSEPIATSPVNIRTAITLTYILCSVILLVIDHYFWERGMVGLMDGLESDSLLHA